MPSPLTNLRVRAGRFCQMNCFQEALLPVLEHEYGCDPRAFDILRMMTWAEIADALRQDRSPGSVGGLQWDAMTELYAIIWHTAPAGADTRQALEHLAASGTPICRVDRFHVPADRQWHGLAHRAHAILVVALDDEGIAYSDAEYLHTPGRIRWADLDRALVRDPNGELELARTVAGCTDLGDDGIARLERDYLDRLGDVLATPAATVQGVLGELADRLAGLDPQDPTAGIAGVEAAAFINAMAKSFLAAAALAARRGVAETECEALARWGRSLEVCMNRALTYADTYRPRHLERFRESVASVITSWDDGTRSLVRQAVVAAAV